MLHTLVVPLDGSDLAERALQYAVPLARAAHGRIILVRIVLPPTSMDIEGAGQDSDQSQAVRDAERYLRAMGEGVGDQLAVETILAYGHPAAQILDQVRRLEADAIVMASHGRTGLMHLLYGSVPESVLAHSPVPVFLVHARPGKPAGPAFDSLARRLMVPLDGSMFAEAALELASDFLGRARELVLTTVVQAPDHVWRDEQGRAVAYLDQQAQSSMSNGLGYVEDVARRFRQKHPDIQVSVDVRMGKPDAGIIEAAEQHATDLIVMATHGRTGLRRNTVGSVAGDVLRHGTTPLLLIRPVMPPDQPATPAPQAHMRESMVLV